MFDNCAEVEIRIKHSEARSKVCLLCFNKATIEIASLPSLVTEQISKHIFSDFDTSDHRLPLAISKKSARFELIQRTLCRIWTISVNTLNFGGSKIKIAILVSKSVLSGKEKHKLRPIKKF